MDDNRPASPSPRYGLRRSLVAAGLECSWGCGGGVGRGTLPPVRGCVSPYRGSHLAMEMIATPIPCLSPLEVFEINPHVLLDNTTAPNRGSRVELVSFFFPARPRKFLNSSKFIRLQLRNPAKYCCPATTPILSLFLCDCNCLTVDCELSNPLLSKQPPLSIQTGTKNNRTPPACFFHLLTKTDNWTHSQDP